MPGFWLVCKRCLPFVKEEQVSLGLTVEDSMLPYGEFSRCDRCQVMTWGQALFQVFHDVDLPPSADVE